jgi:hypothetical protein
MVSQKASVFRVFNNSPPVLITKDAMFIRM